MLSREFDDAVVNLGETLRPQAGAEVGERCGMGRHLVYLQAAKPLQRHVVAHLFHDSAVRDVVEELEKHHLEEHHPRSRRPTSRA